MWVSPDHPKKGIKNIDNVSAENKKRQLLFANSKMLPESKETTIMSYAPHETRGCVKRIKRVVRLFPSRLACGSGMVSMIWRWRPVLVWGRGTCTRGQQTLEKLALALGQQIQNLGKLSVYPVRYRQEEASACRLHIMHLVDDTILRATTGTHKLWCIRICGIARRLGLRFMISFFKHRPPIYAILLSTITFLL